MLLLCYSFDLICFSLSQVIHQERRGDYLGKTVQIVPHATDMVQRWLKEVAEVSVDGTGATPEVCLIEVSFCCCDQYNCTDLHHARFLHW